MSQATPPPRSEDDFFRKADRPHDDGGSAGAPSAPQSPQYGAPEPARYGAPDPAQYGAPQAPSYAQGGYGTPYQPVTRPTNSMAVVALVSGVLGLTFIPLIGSIVAVIVGPMARREIARSGEDGSALATAGIITGWVGIGLIGFVVVASLIMLVAGVGMFASIANSMPS